MKRKSLGKRFLAGILTAALALSGVMIPETEAKAAAVEETSTLTVDMTSETGDILHGASGFLYGISNEDVPTTNTLVPLKPKVLATKGALGTEHPYGDALDVAETFLSSGGEQVMMYNSNYYGVFGVTANYKDYSKVLKEIIAPHVYEWKQEWKREHGTPESPKDELGRVDIDAAIIYIPINEGTPVVGAPSTDVAWESYYDAIKEGDPDAAIAGPNSAGYGTQFNNTNFKNHIQYCADNDCMPDVITWHELDTPDLRDMSEHMDDFNRIWAGIDWTKWLETHGEKLEMPQIVINEYAEMKDCGVPGALVNWIGRLEDEKIYGCLPFWQQANNLNGLTSDANEGAAAWWVYKWYGDMSGQTVQVQTSTSYERLYGVASIDTNKQSASVLMGGEDGSQKLVLKNIGNTEVFGEEDKVHISVQKAAYNGYAGTVNEVPTILEGNFQVTADGSVEITIPNTRFSDAYFVTVTKTNDEGIDNPMVARYSETYEAEQADFDGLTVMRRADYNPTYYFSDGYAVLMDFEDSELTYEIQVPVDGRYQLNFLYGNGTGSSRNDMYHHKPLNVKQSYQIDGNAAENVIMESTLFTAITDCYTKYVDLKAGTHTVTVTSLEDADVIHDALVVTYAGAYGEELPEWSAVYEAEQADFNKLAGCTNSQVYTKTDKPGYSGNGYVTGLENVKVTEGGGIRWNVVVEDSGIYNFTLRYQSGRAGKANIYIGNTTTTLDSLSKTVAVSKTGEEWQTVTASMYLQKGINIVDVDADVDLALDYMKVQKVAKKSLSEGSPVVIEAENCIPDGSAIEVRDSEGASEGKYVVGYEGDASAASDKNKYLEFTFDAEQEGTYEMQVFQSNDDICGSHSYNIKIIDKYATIQVQDADGRVTEENRYFFINTSSEDTFKEKSVRVHLNKGKNTIKIFNDDSWQVKWGGSQSTPGTNELDNYTPNFDRFVLTPMALETPAQTEERYPIAIQTTTGGYAAADKNEAAPGEDAVLTLISEKGVERVLVNGADRTENLVKGDGKDSLVLQDIREDQKIQVYFEEGSGEYIDPYITNAGFGTKDLRGWEASDSKTAVDNRVADSLEGYYVQMSNGTLKQTVTGIPEGDYLLNVYSKAKSGAAVSGQAVLKAQDQSMLLMAGNSYMENLLRVSVGSDGTMTIEADASALNGTICLDRFSLEKVPERNMEQVDELLAYFVDCGDHNPATLTDGDLFGAYNSVTDQHYGQDRITGYSWGVVTTEEDSAISRGEQGVYTTYQWANENLVTDHLDKTKSFRYAHDQIENGISPRYVKYRFELEPGEYSVAVCMGNTWGNAGNPQIYLNENAITDSDFSVAANTNRIAAGKIDLGKEETNEKGRVVLEVRAQSNDATIQMNYITIAPYRETADLSELQKLYDETKDTQQENYTARSWSAFQGALSTAEALIRENSETSLPFTRQAEVNEAQRTLKSAFQALVLISEVQDSELFYFVDCGDHDPGTLTGKDKFGIYNSVTDQLYGTDAFTGKKWGVVTSDKDVKIEPQRAGDKAVYTTYQRANQNSDEETADGQNKKKTYRYAHNQQESGIAPRYVKYQFELEPGTYEVEVCMGNNWGNSPNPDVYLNDAKVNPDALEIPQSGNKIVTGVVTVAEGESLLAAAYSDDPTINMNYIKIRTGKEPEPTDAVLSGLEVTAPQKTEYEQGEELDLTGMKVTAAYSDGTEKEVSAEDCTVEGYDKDAVGQQTITVSYTEKGVTKEAAFQVTVKEKTPEPAEAVLTGLEVTAPQKTEYEQGEELDLTGMTVTAAYSDGTEKKVSTEDCTVEGYDKDAVGQQTITVSYTEKGVTKEASFQVTVKEKAPEPEPKSYTLTYKAGNGGTIQGETTQKVVSGGSGTAVTAIPEKGYRFSRWNDGVPTVSRTDINVTNDYMVTAEFVPAVPEKILLDKKKITMGVKEKVTLKAGIQPDDVSAKITWKSSKSSVASVSSKGVVKAKKAGTATITARTSNGVKAVCKIVVKKAPKKITVKGAVKTLKRGKTYKIRYKLPAKTASYKITYKSSKKSVASVSFKGVVTAKKKGTAYVTLRTFNGKKARIKIQVK